MNVIFALLFTAALGFAAATGNMKGFTDGLFGGVKGAVDIAIGLTGVLAAGCAIPRGVTVVPGGGASAVPAGWAGTASRVTVTRW